ncbi:M23 family metallopeptidase [Micromonospora sp. NPDC049060]|uniref:M23 family metallopeptidase n=1 Tax=Micromonospora sp. NPDC049060 TaxID=3154828 RepID=UPI0033FC3AA3
MGKETAGRRLRALTVAAAVLCGLALVPAQPAAAQTGAMIQPVGGRVTGVLSNRCGATDSDHYGVDVAGNGGMAIGAAYPGTVAFAGWTSGGGNSVTLSHAGGYQTRYLHMVQPASVALGQQVGQGQVLGYVGSTGNSTGPHLHFEIRRNGAVHNIALAYACGATVTKGAPINLPFPDLTPAGAAPDRFAFVNSAGVLYAKDGAYSSWQAVNAGGATKVVLSGNRIGWVQGGNFYAKDGIQGGWLTMAEGGQVSDVAVGGDDWFAFIGGGNFFAKQGVHAGWLTMAGGGQVGDVDIAT